MMILSAIRTHFDYTAWASARLVNAAGSLSPEELTKDFGTADHSVLGTLVHVYAADRIWYDRVHGNAPARFIEPERDMHLHVLQNEWPVLLRRWHEWAAAQTEESLATKASYKDLKGNSYETPLGQIALHLVNHGTHHRGQVSGFLRAMGHVPPPLDLIAYYRELAATASAG
ncbi:MAG TPA: DinB family protein [Bryobacteraceae bacterium]|nr:DinB family protein [Bryobacteraceae bacterium]